MGYVEAIQSMRPSRGPSIKRIRGQKNSQEKKGLGEETYCRDCITQQQDGASGSESCEGHQWLRHHSYYQGLPYLWPTDL